jgi:putative transposase
MFLLFEVRYVSANGGIRWNRQWGHVSTTCARASIGFEDIAGGVWKVSFGPLVLGRRLERRMRSEEADRKLKRHR